MKLRNKKTGETRDIGIVKKVGNILSDIDGRPLNNEYYDSLAEFNEEWEDAPEEPKALGWRIDKYNEPEEIGFGFSLEELEYLKEIGLWFETEEEVEKAVEKLKAWQRLEDKGLKIKAKIYRDSFVKKYICLEANWGVLDGDFSDVLICFGDEK